MLFDSGRQNEELAAPAATMLQQQQQRETPLDWQLGCMLPLLAPPARDVCSSQHLEHCCDRVSWEIAFRNEQELALLELATVMRTQGLDVDFCRHREETERQLKLKLKGYQRMPAPAAFNAHSQPELPSSSHLTLDSEQSTSSSGHEATSAKSLTLTNEPQQLFQSLVLLAFRTIRVPFWYLTASHTTVNEGLQLVVALERAKKARANLVQLFPPVVAAPPSTIAPVRLDSSKKPSSTTTALSTTTDGPPYKLTLTQFLLIPRDAHGNPTSIGSLEHSYGTCRPCAFHNNPKKPGCSNGSCCAFCHFPHVLKRKPKGFSDVNSTIGVPRWVISAANAVAAVVGAAATADRRLRRGSNGFSAFLPQSCYPDLERGAICSSVTGCWSRDLHILGCCDCYNQARYQFCCDHSGSVVPQLKLALLSAAAAVNDATPAPGAAAVNNNHNFSCDGGSGSGGLVIGGGDNIISTAGANLSKWQRTPSCDFLPQPIFSSHRTVSTAVGPTSIFETPPPQQLHSDPPFIGSAALDFSSDLNLEQMDCHAASISPPFNLNNAWGCNADVFSQRRSVVAATTAGPAVSSATVPGGPPASSFI